MDNQKKEIGKPLTTDEIRAQAHNWTLAGDVGLLAHLEQFSEAVLKKTQDTQCSMNDLINSYEETSTIISNVTNQFLAIQNSQFVENRVYDDETPSEEKKLETKEVDKAAEEQLMLSRYKEAVEKGIKLLNTHFEEVQLPPSSDSDEEDFSSENGALIWKPKNPYSGKQFPLLIGSAEWWADDNVGLGEYEENVDSERVLSESDSDMEGDRNIEKRVRMSSSSSLESDSGMNKKIKIPESSSAYDDIFNPGDDKFESDLFLKKGDDLFEEPENIFGESKEIPKVSHYLGDTVDATNTFHEKVSKDPLFDSVEDDEMEKQSEIQPVSVKQKKVENAFTKELAAKLGSVANKQAESPKLGKPEVPFERKPGKKQENAFLVDNEDNNDDLFSSKPISTTTTSAKKPNLFSDLDNDDQLFSGSDNLFRGDSSKNFLRNDFSSSLKSSSNNSSQGNNSDVNISKSAVPKKESLFDGDLFANIDDDDDTLFSSTSKISHPQNSRTSLDENENSSPKVKFSTPFETKNSALDASDDLFGTISAVDVYDNSSTNVSDGSLNAARMLEDDLTQDLGFSEHSQHDISRNKSLKVVAEESPNLFRPQLSSTRRISQETSDYKTQKIFSDHDMDSSNMPHSQDGSKDKMGHNEKSHFSRAQSDFSKSGKGFFAEDDDDLFSSNISKSTPPNLFDEKKSKDSNVFSSKKHDTLFEDDDNSLFADAPKQPDSVSVSSSRSSLFDEASVGKSTLSSVFDGNKSLKSADDLFKTGSEDLFVGDKTDDLFNLKSKESKSLFGNFNDADDLFSSKTSKNLFSDDGAEDLFGGSSKKDKSKPDVAAKPERPVVPIKIKESKIENVGDDLFSNREKSEVLKSEIKNDEISKEEVVPDKLESKKIPDDIFSSNKTDVNSKKDGKLFFQDDNTDDLFSSSSKKIAEELPDEIKKTKSLFNDLADDDNLFSVKPTKIAIQKSDQKNVKNANVSKVKDDPLGLADEPKNIVRPEKAEKPEKPEKAEKPEKPEKAEKPGKTEKPSPPKSLNIKKIVLTDEKEEPAAKPKKIGKLNIPTSLNINPTALLPNASVPKFEKSKEPEASLDSPVEVSSNLLKCTNKDRVKIKVQRRPQSRRARQEALRSSGIDFGSESEKPSVTLPSKTAETITKPKNSSDLPESGDSSGSIFHSVENSPDTLFSSPLPSNPLSPSTDEEDYFNVPELDVNFEKEDQSIFKSNLRNNIKKTDDSLLFDGAPVLSPLSPKKDVLGIGKPEEESPEKKSDLFSGSSSSSKIKKQKIFDDDDEADSDEDNLFRNADSNSLSSDKSKKNPPTVAKPPDDQLLFSENKPFKLSANNEVVKKNLFDEDDNEDLFGGKPVSQIPSSKIPKEVNVVSKTTVKKSSAVDKSKESFVDPLGLMSNPD